MIWAFFEQNIFFDFSGFFGVEPDYWLGAKSNFFWQKFFDMDLTAKPGPKFKIRALWVEKRVKTTFRIL
jgi:hypothetical protein